MSHFVIGLLLTGRRSIGMLGVGALTNSRLTCLRNRHSRKWS